MRIKGFQVLNRYRFPASNDFDWFCIFPTKEKAQGWIDYLEGECGLDVKGLRIVEVWVEGNFRVPV